MTSNVLVAAAMPLPIAKPDADAFAILTRLPEESSVAKEIYPSFLVVCKCKLSSLTTSFASTYKLTEPFVTFTVALSKFAGF